MITTNSKKDLEQLSRDAIVDIYVEDKNHHEIIKVLKNTKDIPTLKNLALTCCLGVREAAFQALCDLDQVEFCQKIMDVVDVTYHAGSGSKPLMDRADAIRMIEEAKVRMAGKSFHRICSTKKEVTEHLNFLRKARQDHRMIFKMIDPAVSGKERQEIYYACFKWFFNIKEYNWPHQYKEYIPEDLINYCFERIFVDAVKGTTFKVWNNGETNEDIRGLLEKGSIWVRLVEICSYFFLPEHNDVPKEWIKGILGANKLDYNYLPHFKFIDEIIHRGSHKYKKEVGEAVKELIPDWPHGTLYEQTQKAWMQIMLKTGREVLSGKHNYKHKIDLS